MRIVYGIHGYGRGHATRALAVLPTLATQHELMVLAGSDAFDALSPKYPVTRIPVLRYHHGRNGQVSIIKTARQNLALVHDLVVRGGQLTGLAERIARFAPQVAVSDCESLTFRAARLLGLPTISFDHFGLIAYCALNVPRRYRAECWLNSFAYRTLFGTPDRAIVSSFFPIQPSRTGVCVVGAVIRREVRAVAAGRGDYLVVYLSQGHDSYTPRVHEALRGAGCPVRVYGTPWRGLEGNIEFKPLDNLTFIHDLAGCRSALATAGNQLLGETLYFRKPVFCLPINTFEQRLNALEIERLGVGVQGSTATLTGQRIRAFLARHDEFETHMPQTSGDGATDAIAALNKYASELAASRLVDAPKARAQPCDSSEGSP